MIGVEIKADSDGLMVEQKLLKLKQLPFLAEANIKTECPVDTGNLRASIHTEMIDENTTSTGTRIKYALPVEFGSAPHVIRPNEAKALRFKGSGGSYVFSKLVHHPGTDPNPFFERGVERTIREVAGV